MQLGSRKFNQTTLELIGWSNKKIVYFYEKIYFLSELDSADKINDSGYTNLQIFSQELT